jgi:hypothetical protein
MAPPCEDPFGLIFLLKPYGHPFQAADLKMETSGRVAHGIAVVDAASDTASGRF